MALSVENRADNRSFLRSRTSFEWCLSKIFIRPFLAIVLEWDLISPSRIINLYEMDMEEKFTVNYLCCSMIVWNNERQRKRPKDYTSNLTLIFILRKFEPSIDFSCCSSSLCSDIMSYCFRLLFVDDPERDFLGKPSSNSVAFCLIENEFDELK